MRKAIFVFIALVVIVAYAQEKSVITVKESTLSTGVVVIDIQTGGKSAELQCNQGPSTCKLLKPGKYTMVELPKNHGMYDCQNADIYTETGNPVTDEKIGEYCLIRK